MRSQRNGCPSHEETGRKLQLTQAELSEESESQVRSLDCDWHLGGSSAMERKLEHLVLRTLLSVSSQDSTKSLGISVENPLMLWQRVGKKPRWHAPALYSKEMAFRGNWPEPSLLGSYERQTYQDERKNLAFLFLMFVRFTVQDHGISRGRTTAT